MNDWGYPYLRKPPVETSLRGIKTEPPTSQWIGLREKNTGKHHIWWKNPVDPDQNHVIYGGFHKSGILEMAGFFHGKFHSKIKT